jgi:rhodanese-related sulfurtransferase
MPTSIDRAELQRLVRDEQAQVVEVLPAEDFEQEHIPGAVSLPLKQLDAASAGALDPSRPVIVYCWDSI